MPRITIHKTLLILFAFACLIAPSTQLHADHHSAKDEHTAAEEDHAKWLKQLRAMRVDHQRALAALKRLEAEILEHEAELEEQISEIEDHRHHIAEHDAAIAAGKGDAAEADHKKIEMRHAKIAEEMKSAHDDHKDLISGLMKFVEGHLKKFHHDHD